MENITQEFGGKVLLAKEQSLIYSGDCSNVQKFQC